MEQATWPAPVVESAVAAACERLGLRPDGIEVLPSGSNHVVHLTGAALVVRVAPPGWRDRLEAQIRLAAALVEQGVPVGRPASGILDLRVGDDQVAATVWSYEASDAGAALDWRALGELVGRFHAEGDLAAGQRSIPLPARDLAGHVAPRLAAVETLVGPQDAALLRAWYGRLVGELDQLRYVLPAGVTHGDVQLANVLVTARGPVLVDTDGYAVGPREVDLVWVAEEHLAGRLDAASYQEFVAGTGTDLADWPGLPTLARLRELSHTSWLLLRRDRHPPDAELAERMLSWWRAGAPLGEARSPAGSGSR